MKHSKSIDKVLIYFPDTGGYNFTPPYEVLFQVKALQNSGVEIILADSRTDNVKEIIDQNKDNLLLVIISTLIKYTSITISRQYTDGLKIAEYTKRNSDAWTLWTGLAASILTDKIIEKNYNNFVLTGISDNKINAFIESLRNKQSFNLIPSLVYKENGQINKNEDDKYYNSFKDYGNFDFNKIDLKPYIHNQTLDYIASNGCVNSCSFCSVPNIYCQHWNHNSIENILAHFEYIFDKYQEIKIIHFRDDNFLVNKSFIHGLLKTLEEKNIRFIWSAQTSVNILKNFTENDLIALHNSGCNNISIGVESGDDYILEKVTKSKTTKTESIEQIKKLIKSNITVSVTSIISFPYNNGRDFNKTLRFLMKLKLLYPNLSIYCTVLQPIPGSEIYKEIYDSIKDFSEDLLNNNKWTSVKKRHKLKKFESFYFIFDRKDFYKSLPEELGNDLKIINKFFSPLIKLRFRCRCTNLMWEYEITKNRIRKIKYKHNINSESILSDVGIRHLTSNYNYGFKSK
ncbi:MAG TPA: radical SAM protein [Bacteroidales bacterium]|nr:radical SAM protein [Bacteroidales bacterium]